MVMDENGEHQPSDDEHYIPNYEEPPIASKHTYFLRTTSNRFVGSCKKSFTWPLNQDERRNGCLNSHHRKCASSDQEDRDVANCLVMLSNNSFFLSKKEAGVAKGKFQCKACKKVFNSHQALGGHRASHKKVKGCFASRFDNDDDDNNNNNLDDSGGGGDDENIHGEDDSVMQSNAAEGKAEKVHECSVCHRVFSSGQALGGHKRCHWLSSNLPASTSDFVQNFKDQFQFDGSKEMYKKPMFRKLDLNLSPMLDEAEDNYSQVKFEGQARIYPPPTLNQDYEYQNQNNYQQHHEEGKMKKVSKLSDLDGGGSTWLKVGIGSTSTGRANP